MKRCVLIAVAALAVKAVAFPRPTDVETVEFRRLYRDCLERCCDKNASLSGLRSFGFNDNAYAKLCEFGPEIFELLYQESVTGEIARAVLADNRYLPFEVVADNERILGDLWCLHAFQSSSKYVDVDFLWQGEPISFQWEGGDVIARERASFLVKEMRIAKQENRCVDARRAMGNLQIMGVFAFPTLFGELTQGQEDVVDVLVAEEWPSKNKPALTKEGLLKWWKENASRYELPRQAPDFNGSAMLEKWERIESKDRKIKVYDAVNGGAALGAVTNSTSRLTCIDLLGCVDSITAEGTNMLLKCVDTGMRYRCIFNGILYGARCNNYGEVLVLPEGSSLVMTNGEREISFFPIVACASGKSGFYVGLKKDDIEHGKVQKDGFLLFAQSDDSVRIDNAATARGNVLGCNLKGVVLKQTLVGD